MSESNASLADFYAEGYSGVSDEEGARLGRWRALGASVKAGHVVDLLGGAGVVPERVVEIGCGDGALLAELSARGVGESLEGFELSAPAAALARARAIPRVARIEAYDGARVPAQDGTYSLAILSHVLEHVPEPASLLAEAARVASLVLVEVPLEANRSAQRPGKRAEAARIGHVQAFSREDVAALLRGAGLSAVADLADPLPRAEWTFFADTPRARAVASAKWLLRTAAYRVAPRLAERAFTVHYAVLARR